MSKRSPWGFIVAFAAGVVVGLVAAPMLGDKPDPADARQRAYARSQGVSAEHLAGNEAGGATPQPREPAKTESAKADAAKSDAATAARDSAAPPVARDSAATPAAPKPKPAPITVAPKQRSAPRLSPEKLVAAHWESSIDAEWSEKAAQELRQDFTRLDPERSFTVVNIDCRKTSCIAVLDWSRQSDAEQAQADLLGAAYSLVCSKKLIFPPGKSPTGYQTTLVFYECERD